ncbi:MAG: TolC family protein, partial [Rubrivivax sp.]
MDPSPFSRASRLGLLALAPLWLAACASLAPDAVDGAPAARTLPAAYSRSLPAVADKLSRDWWAAFGDPLLLQLVDEALAANTDIATARANLAQARAQRDIVAAGQSLQLGSSASAGRNRSNNRTGNTLQAGVDASWEADLFGARAQATQAADAQAAASSATLQATRLAVAANTAIAYLQWQGTRRQLGIARDSVASQEKTLQLAQWRAQAGLVSALDVAQTRSSLEQTRATLPALQTTLAQSANQIAVFT